MTRRLAGLYESHRHALLFYTLLFTLGVGPLLTILGVGDEMLQIFLAFNLIVAVVGVPGRRWRTILVVLAAIALALHTGPLWVVGERMATGTLAVVSGIAFLAVTRTMRFALRATVIESEHIYAALSAYLLAGLAFGVLHWAIALAWPDSFGETRPFTLPMAIYYSFVTLATLGYGDVVPKTEIARGIAILEAVGGQLYIAVTIARLVGAQSPRSRRES